MSRLPMRLPGREREHFEDKVFLSTATDKQGELIIYGGTVGEYPLTIYNGSTVKFRVDKDGDVINAGYIRTSQSEWYYEKYMDAINLSPGGSGATQTMPSTNTIGGYQLDADTEYLYFNGILRSNWDGASDIKVDVVFEVNVDNTGGLATDTVDFSLLCYYKGDGETANKTQTPTASVTVGQSAQYKQFTATFTIDWDLTDNVAQVGDTFAFRLNLNTTASEVDNVIVNFVRIYYQTKMPQPEI